jgi:aminomethyltransferase
LGEELRKTPLHALHVGLGARMAPFAGYDMPVQYPAGILKEHLHTRAAAGLFDVSHMGQIAVRPRSGEPADAARALEGLAPVDLLGLAPGRQRYALLTDDKGGIRDDLMVANRGDHLLLVVNAACKADDLAHLQAGLGGACEVEPLERGLIALQGPKAAAVLGALGARDSLRLEAGLCLYGVDIDRTTTPVEAALEWAIQPARRAGGARAGGFPGAEAILGQIASGASRRRVGLLPEGRAPMRGGTELFDAGGDEVEVGRVTSGGFGPSLDRPVAMGYVAIDRAAPGTRLLGRLRGKMLPVTVAKLPLVPRGYERA